MKTWSVVVPYYYEFVVEAIDEDEAIQESKTVDGKILFRGEDEEAEVELLEEYESCDACGSTDIWSNSSDELQCNNCGFSEGG